MYFTFEEMCRHLTADDYNLLQWVAQDHSGERMSKYRVSNAPGSKHNDPVTEQYCVPADRAEQLMADYIDSTSAQ